jgi:hypothetical protein
MKIHLVRSEEVATSHFGAIADVILKFRGPVEFVVREEDVTENGIADVVDIDLKTLSWDTLFGFCEDYRTKRHIPKDELVCLMTDHSNERNWFSSWDPSGKLNFFIQTSAWENFVEADPVYPVIYELATLPFFTLTCENLSDVLSKTHSSPKGCPFDMCQNKYDALLRLRTGDICLEHRDLFEIKDVPPAITKQIYKILDHVRNQILFRGRSRIIKELSPLIISYKTLRFPGFLDSSVILNPKQMTVFRFFLANVEGVPFRHMTRPRHIQKLTELYRNYSDSDESTVINRVNRIINLREGHQIENHNVELSQIINKINNKISDCVPTGLLEHYQITGDIGEPRLIKLDRNLITML